MLRTNRLRETRFFGRPDLQAWTDTRSVSDLRCSCRYLSCTSRVFPYHPPCSSNVFSPGLQAARPRLSPLPPISPTAFAPPPTLLPSRRRWLTPRAAQYEGCIPSVAPRKTLGTRTRHYAPPRPDSAGDPTDADPSAPAALQALAARPSGSARAWGCGES